MGLLGWLKRRKNRNTEHVTYVPPKVYKEMERPVDSAERSARLGTAARQTDSTVRRTPSSPSRTAGRPPNDVSTWPSAYTASDSSPSHSSGCSDSGSSSSSSDSGSSGGCD